MQVQNCIYIKFEIKHKIDGYTSFRKRRIDDCSRHDSTLVQASNRRLQSSNRRLY